MTTITDAKVIILATDGFEKSELFEPKKQLAAEGMNVQVASPELEPIKSWDDGDWGETVDVDLTLDDINVDEYDALVLPGGQINPDVLRLNDAAVQLVKDFFSAGKVVAAICHAPWLLIEAGIVDGRKVTSYGSIATDLKNAGGRWVDVEVAVDKGLITSRDPNDLDAFCRKIIEEVQEGQHKRA